MLNNSKFVFHIPGQKSSSYNIQLRHRNSLLESEQIMFKPQNQNIKKLYDTMVAFPIDEGVLRGMSLPVQKEFKPRINRKAEVI